MTNRDESAAPEIYTQSASSAGGTPYSDTYSVGGLTKREHFAAMAMQGRVANAIIVSTADYSDLADDAVILADALIEALNK